MIKVGRTVKPPSLQTNEIKWRDDLLDQIRITGSYSKVSESYKNKYNQADVKEVLANMYEEKCCYCETGIGVSDYPNIEHLKPKSLRQFHHLAFQWDNLHWSCERCNTKKGKQWNDQFPILDPTVDTPEHYLLFDVNTCEVYPIANGESRGKTTIDHVELNREGLVRARKRVRKVALTYINKLLDTPSPNDEKYYRDMLEEMLVSDLPNGQKSEYSMFIKALIHHYLK